MPEAAAGRMLGRGRPGSVSRARCRRWFAVRIVLAIIAVVLALPVLVMIGIALGPVALLVAWALLCVAPFVLIGWAGVWIANGRWRHTS
jgi:hypothetical protein